MTKHKEEEAFTVESVLRNFPPIEPFVVGRVHPLMVRDDTLDPNDLKKPGGVQQKYSDDDILDPLKTGRKTTTQWLKELKAIGISQSGFYNRLEELQRKGRINKQGKKWGLAQPTTQTAQEQLQYSNGAS